MLWIYAHPEPRSLGGSLKDAGLRMLTDLGHEVRVSDLYAMGWRATVDASDYTGHDPDDRLIVARASKHAYLDDTLSADVRAEQRKLDWADAVVLQFPLWWYGMPAIMKGWVDRVFVKGYAYGVAHPDQPGRTLRYGEGKLAGKRALVVTTTGSREPAFGPRGINGQLEQAMFPLLHGTLWYVGMDVLRPLAIYGADRFSVDQYADATAALCERLTSLGKEEPIAYRYQNHGDYDDDLVLRPEHAPGQSGLGVHVKG